MTKLSDTQAILLSAAAQRADGNLLPLPGSLRGGAAIKVVTALLARDLAREEVTELQTRADAALNTVWRNEPDGRAVLLRIAPAGLEAIGIEPASEPSAAPTGDPVEYRFNAGINSAGEPAAGPAEAAAPPVEAPKKKGRPKKVAAATEPSAASSSMSCSEKRRTCTRELSTIMPWVPAESISGAAIRLRTPELRMLSAAAKRWSVCASSTSAT